MLKLAVAASLATSVSAGVNYDMGSCYSRCFVPGARAVPTAQPARYTNPCPDPSTVPESPSVPASSRSTTYWTYNENGERVPYNPGGNAVSSGGTTTTCSIRNDDGTLTPVDCAAYGLRRRLLGATPEAYQVDRSTVSRCYVRNADGSTTDVECPSDVGQTTYQSTSTVMSSGCSEEEYAANAARELASEEAYLAWVASEEANNALIASDVANGVCHCDLDCVAVGDCCADMGWWCTVDNVVRSLNRGTGTYDFPFPGTVHEHTVVTQPTQSTARSTRCYTRNADGTTTDVACPSGTTTSTVATAPQPTQNTASANTKYYVVVDGVRKEWDPVTQSVVE